MKRKCTIYLLSLFVLMLATTAHAQPTLKTNFSTTTSTVNLINYVDGYIAQASSSMVDIYCQIVANQVVDEISQTMYLQQWSGSSWVTVTAFSKVTVYNINLLEDSRIGNVTQGQTYRLKIISTAKNSFGTDTRTTYSDSIQIQ